MVLVNKQPVSATSKLVTAEKAPEGGHLHNFAQRVRTGWHCPPGASLGSRAVRLISDSLRRRAVREADAGAVWEGMRLLGHLSCKRWEGGGRGLQGAPGTSPQLAPGSHSCGTATARAWLPPSWLMSGRRVHE